EIHDLGAGNIDAAAGRLRAHCRCPSGLQAAPVPGHVHLPGLSLHKAGACLERANLVSWAARLPGGAHHACSAAECCGSSRRKIASDSGAFAVAESGARGVSVMSCSVRDALLPKTGRVVVNGVVIARDAIARESQNHPSASPIKAWQAAAHALVVRELLLQEARRIGVAAVPLDDGEGRRETEEESLIRALIEQEVATPVADTETCRRYYEQN